MITNEIAKKVFRINELKLTFNTITNGGAEINKVKAVIPFTDKRF